MKRSAPIFGFFFCAFVLLSFNSTSAQNKSTTFPDHKTWDVLLKKHVDDHGFVAYNNFLKDQDQLTNYLNNLSINVPDDSWTNEEQIAYYINLYNAATIDLILQNYPVLSIKDIQKPWATSFIKIGDKNYSLGDLEHHILRKIKEPRIHFAINCASISCPKLLNEAYVASKLEKQLEQVTLDFINGDENNISASDPKLSKIFKWYKKDFIGKEHSSLISYINQYSEQNINPDAKVIYMEYNWNLNQLK